jgi:hypothetical protein
MNSSLVFVLLIVAMVMTTNIVQTYLKQRKIEPEANEDLGETVAKIEMLEERIKVLERIVTENRFDLKKEIDSL